MLTKRIAPIVFIFICVSIAWFILGGVTQARTYSQDTKLKQAVGQLWGTAQSQHAPTALYQTKKEKKVETTKGGKTTVEVKTVTESHPLTLDGSDITVDLQLGYRKKGLLWYSTYQVAFSGKYLVANDTQRDGSILFTYAFPISNGIYDDFTLIVDGKKIEDLRPVDGWISTRFNCGPGQTKTVEIAYKSQGMNEWRYIFGDGVSQIRNFSLTMTTDFDKINFPESTISPTEKEKLGDGWKLKWQYSNLISGIQIGMEAPKKLNPGPFASKVSFFAPVSLFLFLFLMFIITTVRGIKIHPMNYFFLSSAFFSFHLLMAYLIDHLNIHASFAICSVVSIFLVISYMRLVVGTRFALIETGLSQLVYLILFSYAFFLKGFTGLAITIGCIITLFIVMQFTGRIDWEEQFRASPRRLGEGESDTQ